MELADIPRHRPLAFDKMESLIKEMQDPETGVPVRSQKLFLSVIPSAFMGYDLIEWLMERYGLEETNSNVEAINLANQLCQYGYFFPVNDLKNLVLKDDSSLYRFQSPYYWPWQTSRVAGSGSSAPSLGPDNIEYAIYLVKRTLRNKQRHALEEYEQEALANLKKNLAAKWDFITMQAEEQVRLAKDRKKGEKIVSDSQERAYWRVARPPPGVPSALEPCPVPVRTRNPQRPKKRTLQQLVREIEHLKASLDRTRVKTSIALEALVAYSETFAPYDPWLTPPQPSNPWISDDTLFWQINSPLVDVPSEKRVQRWALSIDELISDPTGLQEFTSFLRKEYSHENIRFWLAVMDLRRSSTKHIPIKLEEIYQEFLKPGAPCEINIDGATAEKVAEGLRSRSRYALDDAADHVYGLLLKKDCYPRFIRSDHFQRLLTEGKNVHQKKAKFFNFGGGGQVKKKPGVGVGGGSAGPLSRRRGSDRSLSGSAHELAVSAAQPPRPADPPPHSHSQSNLADIPFRDPLDDSSMDEALPWETSSSSREGSRGTRRRQDSAADSGSSSSDVSALGERTRRLPQQSTLDGGLRGAPPPLRRLSAVEPRHLAPLASPPASPRARPAPAPAPAPAPPHPTPTISVSSAPDDESPPSAASPEPRSLPHSDDPPSVFASADVTPTEPARPLAERAASLEKTVSPPSCDSRTDVSKVDVSVPPESRGPDRPPADDDDAPSARGTLSREPSTTRELSPASSKDSSRITDLPVSGSEQVSAAIGLTSVVPMTTTVPMTPAVALSAPPAPPTTPLEPPLAPAADDPGPTVPPAPTEKADEVAKIEPMAEARERFGSTMTVSDVSAASSALSTISATNTASATSAASTTSMTSTDSAAGAPSAPSAASAARTTDSAASASAASTSSAVSAASARPPVAPLAVGEDIGVDDDNVDKVPSAPVQRVSRDSRATSHSEKIAHKDELSSVSGADIVKRDNKSEVADRKQRNDICPWEDENSCESDAPFVKTYATLGYL